LPEHIKYQQSVRTFLWRYQKTWKDPVLSNL